ncbi:MAG: hypothetical protein ACYTG6_02650 [Planctomycetota bacterium]|jgi:hypothetical protein
MRVATTLFTLALLVFAFQAVAGGEEEGEDPIPALEKRIQVLEQKVEYLTAREEALTTYVLAAEQRSKSLAADLARSRAEGFTAGAISSTSREFLLAGLDGLAASMVEDLPAVTPEQRKLLEGVRQPSDD